MVTQITAASGTNYWDIKFSKQNKKMAKKAMQFHMNLVYQLAMDELNNV